MKDKEELKRKLIAPVGILFPDANHGSQYEYREGFLAM
jgi:hypothetical protein